MKLDPRVVAIAKQFEPGLPLANWTDDNRRAWVMQVIEQVVFRFPDGGWGAKRSRPRRPLSEMPSRSNATATYGRSVS